MVGANTYCWPQRGRSWKHLASSHKHLWGCWLDTLRILLGNQTWLAEKSQKWRKQNNGSRWMMFQHGMVTGKKAGTRTNLRNLAFHCSICNRDLFILFLLILQLGPKLLGIYTHIRTWVKAAVEVAAMSLKQHVFLCHLEISGNREAQKFTDL